jgi:hypothetical protein
MPKKGLILVQFPTAITNKFKEGVTMKKKVSGLLLPGLLALLLFTQNSAAWASTTTVPFYRFYYDGGGKSEHFYSQGSQVPAGWRYERIEGYVSPNQLSYMVPLYRRFHEKTWDHLYTTSTQEIASLAATYDNEGIAGYVLAPDMDIPGTVSLYRFDRTYNIGNRPYQDHFYSLDSATPANYIAEGVACRVWKDKVVLPIMLLELMHPTGETQVMQGGVLNINWKVWNGGGFLRLSYSTDIGASWTPFVTIPLQEEYATVINGSYNWPVPGSLQGKIQLKAEWVKDSNGATKPWVMVKTRLFSVGVRIEKAPIKKIGGLIVK